MMNTDVLQAALRILIPKDILDAFDLEKIEEVKGNTRIFYMVKKELGASSGRTAIEGWIYARSEYPALPIGANAQHLKAEKTQVGKQERLKQELLQQVFIYGRRDDNNPRVRGFF